MSAAQPWAHIAGRPEEDIASYVHMATPLYYCGGNLGVQSAAEPFIAIEDSAGVRYETRSVEWLLQNIDHFAVGRSQDQALAHAAWHLGFDDVYALMGRAGSSAVSLQHGEPA